MPKSVFHPAYVQFVSLLVAARKEAGLTQTELALALNRPQSFVSKYENRERRLDLVEFLEVASALQLDAVAVIHKLQALLRTSD